MLEDADKCEIDEECEDEREWREADWLGSEESLGSPRPRVAMSSTKDGRVVAIRTAVGERGREGG